MDRTERIKRAERWAEGLQPGGPDLTDVLIVAALELASPVPPDGFLWHNPAALRRHWDALQALLRGESTVPGRGAGGYPTLDPSPTPGTPTYPASYRTPTAPHPTASQASLYPTPALGYPAPSPEPSGPAPYPNVVPRPPEASTLQPVEDRWRRLLDLHARSAADADVGLISKDDLRRLAESGATSPDEVRQFSMRTATRSLFDQLAQRLSDALTGGSADGAPPAAPDPQPPTGYPQPTPAGQESEEGPATEPGPGFPRAPFGPVQPGTMDASAHPMSDRAGHADPATQAGVVAPRHPDEPEWIEPLGKFAPFDWGTYTGGTPSLPSLLTTVTPDGVRLSWRAASEAACAIYRVVQSGERWPFVQPEKGTVGATRRTEVLAKLHPVEAVTYLTVWVNEGENEIAARDAQPRLVAKGEVVWAPQNLSISVTPADEVTARFDAPPGAGVEVQRFGPGELVRYNQSKALSQGVLENGFLDASAPPGVQLTYAVYTVAHTPEGISYSDPVTASVSILPDSQSIRLSVEPGLSGPGTYDISWTPPPFGTVEVYLTKDQPRPGLGDLTRTIEVLEMNGVPADRRLNYPVRSAGQMRRIVGVTMDRTWVKGFFFAVHRVSPNAARLGVVESRVSAQPPRFPILVERIDTQVITFEWPEGVRMVEVHQGPLREESIDPSTSEVIASLTEDEYRQRGGLRLGQPLPSNGCALYLYGVVYDKGRKELSAPIRLEYRGISRLQYMIEAGRRDGTPVSRSAKPDFYRVLVRSEDQMAPTPLCLVANGTRLPLHPRDQDDDAVLFIAFPDVSPVRGQVVPLGEFPAGNRPVFVRLFVSSPSMVECGSIAVLDPEIRFLQVYV